MGRLSHREGLAATLVFWEALGRLAQAAAELTVASTGTKFSPPLELIALDDGEKLHAGTTTVSQRCEKTNYRTHKRRN